MEVPRLLGVLLCSAFLTAVPVAAAQDSSTDQLLGTYPLSVTTQGSVCPEGTSATLVVREITDSTITLAIDGGESTLSYQPTAQTFSGDFTAGGFSARLSGNFVQAGDEVFVHMEVTYPGDCRAIFTGSRSVSGDSGSGATGLAAAQGGGDGGDGPSPVLIGGLVAAGLVGAGLAAKAIRKRRRALQVAPAGVGAAGLAGRAAAAAGTVNPAVSAARMGGFEGQTSYGEGAGVAAPAAGKAYEALVAAQAPRHPQGPDWLSIPGNAEHYARRLLGLPNPYNRLEWLEMSQEDRDAWMRRWAAEAARERMERRHDYGPWAEEKIRNAVEDPVRLQRRVITR